MADNNVMKKVAKYSAVITFILIFSKLTGFLRELIVAVSFGASVESDIFKTASTMPLVLFSCVSGAILNTFIPVFSKVKQDRKKADEFFSNIFNILTIICIAISIIAVIYSPVLVKLFAGGFKGQVFDRAVLYTRILVPSVIFMALSALYTGYLQSYGKFIQPALTGIVANVIIIFGIVIFASFGIKAAVIATFIGAVSQVLVQRPFMTGYKHKFFIDLKDEQVKKMFMLAVPMLIYSGVSQVNLMVGRNFASYLMAGSISVVDYATKISTIINQVFIASITMVVYPSLTEKFANDDKTGFQSLINKSMNSVVLVAIPLTFGMAALSSPLVRILLQHGKFDANAAAVTSMCLKYLAIAALAYSLTDILGKIFYAANDTLTPMINGFINVGLNVLFIVIFVPAFGVKGIALATTISTFFIAAIMIIEIKLKLRYIKLREFMNTSAKITLSGLVMALVCILTYNILSAFLGNSTLYSLIKMALSAILAAVVYITALIIFKVDELYSIIPKRFLGNGRWRKK